MAVTPHRLAKPRSVDKRNKTSARIPIHPTKPKDLNDGEHTPFQKFTRKAQDDPLMIALFILLVILCLYLTVGIIKALGAGVVILIVNTLAEWLTEKRSNTPNNQLPQRHVQAMRQGKPPLVTISASDVADGDVLVLKPGHILPVNGLLCVAKDEFVEFEQPSVTGRSSLVKRYPVEKDNLHAAGIENLVISGSRVHQGEGLLWVTHTLTNALIEKSKPQHQHRQHDPPTETSQEEHQLVQYVNDSTLEEVDENQLRPAATNPTQATEELGSKPVKRKRGKNSRRRAKGTAATEADVVGDGEGNGLVDDELLPTAVIDSRTQLISIDVATKNIKTPISLTDDLPESLIPPDLFTAAESTSDDDSNPSAVPLPDVPLISPSLPQRDPAMGAIVNIAAATTIEDPPALIGVVTPSLTPPPQTPSPVRAVPIGKQRALRVPGVLEGVSASGVPDFGSSYDIISQKMVQKHHWLPDNDGVEISYRLPDGKERRFLGTVTLRWHFEGESRPWIRRFHILQDSIYPLLFGRDFLNKTDTMTKSRKRIKEVLINATSCALKRVLYVDQLSAIASSQERILGLVNGQPIFGFADTCSEIPIIKRNIAQQMGFDILEGAEHTTRVQFIDGSTSLTTGTIKDVNWCFGVTSAPEDTRLIDDLHVMDDIPCAMILDTWLLWDSEAFDRYRVDFRYDVVPHTIQEQTVGKQLELEPGAVCTIKVVERAVPASDARETPEAAMASTLIAAADEKAEKEEKALLARMVAIAQQRQLNSTLPQRGTNSASAGPSVPVANAAANGVVKSALKTGWSAVTRRKKRKP